MGIISLVWGIFAILWMLVAMLPLFGWGNWFMLPFALVGAILAIVAIATNKGRISAIIGLILCLVAMGLGSFRLLLGGGII